jgi:hypothetical protein
MNDIARLYDEVMRGTPQLRPTSSIKDLESKIADRLGQLMAAELPMGVNTYGPPQVNSHIEGNQVVFTATITIPHQTTALDVMAQAIKDADK